jgi:hypothetical protein
MCAYASISVIVAHAHPKCVMQSARRNCVDVWTYLTDVLRRIAGIAPGNTAALESLLPDRSVAAYPEHRLEQREEESRAAPARR